MVICSHCVLGGNHLLGISPAMCVGFPHGTEVYLSKKDASHEERVTASGFFLLKRPAWANAACKLRGFTADWLQHSQLRVITHSASACAGFSHPTFVHNIIYRHLGRETQLMKNACAEGSWALCWDSEISDLRIEILGRMIAPFLNLIRDVSSPLTNSWPPVLPAASKAKWTSLSSNCRILSPLASRHSHITSFMFCIVHGSCTAAQPRRGQGQSSRLSYLIWSCSCKASFLNPHFSAQSGQPWQQESWSFLWAATSAQQNGVVKLLTSGVPEILSGTWFDFKNICLTWTVYLYSFPGRRRGTVCALNTQHK